MEFFVGELENHKHLWKYFKSSQNGHNALAIDLKIYIAILDFDGFKRVLKIQDMLNFENR